jgi:uncharacterized FAD-dependent dehydrogenase
MTQSLELVLDLENADDTAAQRREAARLLGCDAARITAVRVRRRSIDARGQIRVRLNCEVWIDEEPPLEEMPRRDYAPVRGERRVVIVGCGPAGMFAALRLIELGIKPIVVERGKDVQARRRDLARINREGVVDAESNYCFGEGGAGTYSTASFIRASRTKPPSRTFCRRWWRTARATEILVEAHPHIGSNRLPQIVAALRESIPRGRRRNSLRGARR